MNRDALAWGGVGAFSFLVLAQGYRLLTSDGPGLLALLGVALVVFAVTTAASSAFADRMRRT